MLVTFSLVAVIEFQHTFADADLEPDEGGAAGDFAPSDAALQALMLELERALRPVCAPRRVELEVDVDLDQGDEPWLPPCALRLEP